MAGSIETRALAPGEVLRLLFERRLTVVATTLVCAAGAVALGLCQRPKFEATATVLLDPTARGGLIGSLTMLSPMGASVTAPGEVAVLRSRGVVESVVAPPVPGAPAAPSSAGFDLHVGLTTTVTDDDHSVWSVFHRELTGSTDGLPPAQPPCRVFASAVARSPDAPARVRAEFLGEGRVRLSSARRLARLGLVSDHAEVLDFAPGAPFDYRGLTLALATEGDVAGRTFTIAAVPVYEAAEGLLERFYAGETLRNSGVIRLTVEDTDPFRAAETANAIVRNYLAVQETRRTQRSAATTGYVEGLLADSQAVIEEAEQELVRVRTDNPVMVNLDAAGEALITEISTLEADSKGLELRERSLREVLDALAQGDMLALARLDSAVSGGLFVDPISEGYLEHIGVLNAQYVELSQTYQDDNPRLVELRSSANELVRLIREQLQSRVEGVAFQRASLEAEAARKSALLADLPADMQALARPLLQLNIQQALIPELLANLKATEIAESSASFSAQLLDPAAPATRLAAPQLFAVLVVGGALGLVLGLLYVLVRDPVTGLVRGRQDLEDILARPVLGTAPLGRRGGGLDRDAVADDAVRSLRAAVKNLRAHGRPVRVLGLTSDASEVARAELSAALARAFAREGARVALLDADLGQRGLTRLFRLEGAPGLSEALRTDAGAPELSATELPGLEVVPAGAVDGASLDLLGSERLERLLAYLAAGRDLVLLDLACLGRPELEALAPKLDGLLIACEEQASRRGAVRSACERIERAGGTVLGSVLCVPWRRRRSASARPAAGLLPARALEARAARGDRAA